MVEKKNKTRVVVAMSGGVDSSVAAVLLHNQGYEVVGVSLKLWDDPSAKARPGHKTCCSYQDIEDARRVCDVIGIPFYAFNHQENFRKNVINTFVSEYLDGRTPNPCILCNRHLKFDQLLTEAQKLGADYLATGHYARIARDPDGRARLLKGRDPSKDQSYVLYGLSQEALKRCLFPVGDFEKDEIRAIAERHHLPVAHKPDSQDICFVPDGDHGKFIRKMTGRVEDTGGDFVDEEGRVLGRHEGVWAYTVGQRRGLGVSGAERYYVTRIDPVANRVYLGTRGDVLRPGACVGRLNWVIPGRAPESLDCQVKVRYQKDEIPATVAVNGEEALVTFDGPQPFVSPGQAAVFYRGDEVLGGGMILKAL